MSRNDIHGIRQGWSVRTIDGEGIGSVEETTERYILVKSGLVNAERRYFPAARLEHVRPEMKEITLDLTNDEVEAGDWSEPPEELPRLEGAPLNPEMDNAHDVARAETAREALAETHEG
jgi:hypothetical protein